MNRSRIGQRIASLRSRMGLSTQQLADRVGKSQATVSRIENGKQGVSVELLSKISRILRIHPFALLSDNPLQHSVLLPPTATIRSKEPMRILARTVEAARIRSHLSREVAAKHLNIDAEELETIELGYALPDRETVDAMAGLYTVDAKTLHNLAMLEDKHPEISERMASMEQILSNVIDILNQNDEKLNGLNELNQLRDEVESCLGISAQSAERKASYFSIGHLSDRLLNALQDPDFHHMVEEMARNFSPAGDGSEPSPSGEPQDTRENHASHQSHENT